MQRYALSHIVHMAVYVRFTMPFNVEEVDGWNIHIVSAAAAAAVHGVERMLGILPGPEPGT